MLGCHLATAAAASYAALLLPCRAVQRGRVVVVVGRVAKGGDGRGKWAVVGSVSSAIDTRQSRTLPLRYTIVVQHGNRNWLIVMVIVICSLIIMVIVEQRNGGTRIPRNKMAGSIV